MSRHSFIAATLLAMLGAGGTAMAADLTVTVTGLRSDGGDVHIALYDRAEGFPKSDGMLSEAEARPKDRRATSMFRNLKPGAYAVAAFHDENGNNSFDQGLFGIPLEDYGFSMGARAFLSAPGFDAAAFTLGTEDHAITIDFGN